MEVDITIGLKKGVADPEGANTKKALNLLGFGDVMDVKSMKTFRINIDTKDREEAEIACEKMCKKLLANPVIQNYSIEIR